MDISKFITPGTVAGVLSFAAVISTLMGKPALAAVFSDPATATQITLVAGGIGALAAGVLKGIHGSTPGPST
jgi:hypothetical protein